jgi:hypothetical protein
MDKPYYAPRMAKRDNRITSDNPPFTLCIHLVASAYNPYKNSFTPTPPPYSAASAATVPAQRGVFSTHNKANFDSKSLDSDSKSLDFDSKSLDFYLKSKPSIFRNKRRDCPLRAFIAS